MFRSRRQRGEVFLVADVGDGSVGVAMLESSDGTTRLIAAEQTTIFSEERPEEARARSVVAALSESAQALQEKLGGSVPRSIEKAYVVVHAPWARSNVIRSEHVFEEEKKIDASVISSHAKAALQEEEISHEHSLEAAVVRVELEGYRTSKPEGKRAKKIGVSMLVSECDEGMQRSISEALTRTFSCPPPIFRSAVRALSAVLSEHDLLPEDCVLLCVHSYSTSLLVFRDRSITAVGYVGEGMQTIARRIAPQNPLQETLSLMRMLARGECETKACEALKVSLAKAEPTIVHAFSKEMEKMTTARRLPNKLLLLAPEECSEWLAHMFSRMEFSLFTHTTLPLQPRVLERNTLLHSFSLRHASDLDSDLLLACELVNIERGSAS